MERRTQAIIAATVVALGIGLVALALVDQESDIRYVADILSSPDAHQSGSYTLLGVPQPPEIPRTVPGGSVVLEPNPEWTNETRTVQPIWHDGDTPYQSVHVVSVHFDETGATHWRFQNETRIAGNAELAHQENTTWTLGAQWRVFLIQGFPDGTGHQPLLWGIMEGSLKDPMQPKPSQFKGRLMTTLPDAQPVPPGALVYEVQEYTAGCSSKFLPPEAQEKYGDDDTNQTA